MFYSCEPFAQWRMAVIWITAAFSEVLFDKFIQPARYSFRLKIQRETFHQRGLVTAAHRRHHFIMKVVTEGVIVSMNRAQCAGERPSSGDIGGQPIGAALLGTAHSPRGAHKTYPLPVKGTSEKRRQGRHEWARRAKSGGRGR